MSCRVPSSLVAFCLAAFATGADWPRFRGPDGSGISPEKGLPVTWTAKDVAWKTDLPGPGASSPIFIGDRIFITCWTGYALPNQPGGNESDLRRHLLCLDRTSGKILWDKAVAAKLPENKLSRGGEGYASSTPVADGERVYCFFGKTGVFAFDHSGKELWQSDVGDGISLWASSASPILHGDLVIVNASNESRSLVALDKKTGKEKWRAKGIEQAWNTPLVVKTRDGKEELVVASARKIFAFDPATGAALWNCNTDITWYMVPSMVAHDGVIYCIGGRDGIIGLAVRAGGRGDVTATHRLWTSRKGGNVSSPVYHDGHIYWMNDASGTAFCAKADTGEVVYEERVPRAGGVFVYASALLADGRIFYVGRDGRTYVVAANPQFELLATNEPLDRTNHDATPVAVDGRLFIRSNRALYCLAK